MTQLLISVRSAAEARIACDCGADLVDVKEPAHGSLGAADPSTIQEVISAVDNRVPVSIALGELLADTGQLPPAMQFVQFAKYGLAGCVRHPDWPDRWRQAIGLFRVGVSAVAVAYADWAVALAPDPWHVLRHAEKHHCEVVLLDTFDKSTGSLLCHMRFAELRRFVQAVKDRGMRCAVAGSLGFAEIAQILPLAPNYVAVRGAACMGDRASSLDESKVRALATLVRSVRQADSKIEMA